MPTVIGQFKQAVLDENDSVSSLLRRALIIAADLNLGEVSEWIKHELQGYPLDDDNSIETLPDYRRLIGHVEAFNPYRGWEAVSFGPELTDKLNQAPIPFSIGSLESTGTKDMGMSFLEPTNSELLDSLSPRPTKVERRLSGHAIIGVIEAVRNRLLTWAIELEKANIAGINNQFSEAEVTAAATIPSMQFGSGSTATINIVSNVADNAQVNVDQSTGYSPEQLVALNELLVEISSMKPVLNLTSETETEFDQSIAELSDELVKDNPNNASVRGFVGTITRVVEGIGTNLATSGILQALSKYV